MRTSLKAQELAALTARLHARGLRRTAPRLAVLAALEKARAPVSHPELCARLEPNGFDRATLYRNLIDLTQAGLVSRTDLGDHVWRFELEREDGDHRLAHPHLICSGCGKVDCLPDVTLHTGRGKDTAVQLPAELEIQLKGLCARCASSS
jgi:Fur family ferric uptake transcriptional regulator